MKTTLPDNKQSFFDRPYAILFGIVAVMTIFYTLQCTFFQNILGLDVLETIIWGEAGGLGNAKHPPLSGWLGFHISALAGHADWIMYLAAQLCIATGVIFTVKCAECYFKKGYEAVTAGLLLYFLFYYNPSETKFCTYPLEIAILPATFYFFLKIRQNNFWRYWIGFAVCTALGLLNKYSFGLYLVAMAVIFFRDKDFRATLKSAKPYVAIALCIALLLPHLHWLIQNDFICFKHVSNRLEDDHPAWLFLLAIATALYPFAMLGAVMLAATFPRRERGDLRKNAGFESLIISAIPALTLVVLSIADMGIIMMWFCPMASFAGIMAVAYFPFKIDKLIFKRIILLLTVFSLAMYIFTTIDVACSSRPRLHSEPDSLATPALAYWREFRNDDIPVVVGPRFEAAVLENYLPGRPQACELGDPVVLDICKEKIKKRGALLVVKSRYLKRPEYVALLNEFFAEMNMPKPELKEVKYNFSARFGKQKEENFFLGYLPPEETASPTISR